MTTIWTFGTQLKMAFVAYACGWVTKVLLHMPFIPPPPHMQTAVEALKKAKKCVLVFAQGRRLRMLRLDTSKAKHHGYINK